MIKSIILSFFLTLMVISGNAKVWTLSDSKLEVRFDDLVSHRFVSPDHKVQESLFSSGKKVVVNFGDKMVEVDGMTIKERGYLIIN